MTNKEYYIYLKGRLEELVALRQNCVSISAKIIGETLFTEDLFFCASADRCIKLIDGIKIMLEERNLTCAGALLRLQMDNCMRTYAAFIAEDKNAVVNCVLDGAPIRHLKDKSGRKMTDGYLKEQITKLDSQFETVYNQASGFIHLSEKAFFQMVDKCENNIMGFQIGQQLPEKRNEHILECADAFIHFIKLHFEFLDAVANSKQRYDKTHRDSQEN